MRLAFVLVAAGAVLMLAGTKERAPHETRADTQAQPDRNRHGIGRLLGAPNRERRAMVGRSQEGRPIRIHGIGGLGGPAEQTILVIGCIHGDECAGTAVVESLRKNRACPPVNDVLAVPNLNPDGRALGSRVNSRGVDLNRNFASGWRPAGAPWDPEHSGPGPFSERESRLARRLIQRLQPDITIWFHQQAEPLVRAWRSSIPAAREYADHSGLAFRRMPWLAGSAPNWQNHAFPGTSSFVIELPTGPIGDRAAWRHARAIALLDG